MADRTTAERRRLDEDARREKDWKRWGPYLAERQWGTVREDYSATGECWDYLPHDHARSRAYRWGEDGLLGITDRQGRLCVALALWNGRDPILKERLFGLTGPEGNHGEDVKECWFHLDALPSHAYLKAVYRYPQAAYPYEHLVQENRRRTRQDPEFELLDTGVLDGGCFWDVTAEYAKAAPDDVLLRVTVANRGPEEATLHLLPHVWFRNTWSWGRTGEGYWPKPHIARVDEATLDLEHASLGRFRFHCETPPRDLLFTDNETNQERLFDAPSASPWVKDAFHRWLIDGERGAVNPGGVGTKTAAHYVLTVPAGGETVLAFRLVAEGEAPARPFGAEYRQVFAARLAETDAFYDELLPTTMTDAERQVARQAYAGLLWTKQFFHYDVTAWLEGDPAQPSPPAARLTGRNHEWRHLYNRDVVSMPDAWEYPWYAAWDLAFHMIPFAKLDPHFAKEQLILFLREWYMHPNGQIPAYEFAFGDVNPPVHAWAAWRVYKMTGPRGARDRRFLARVFQKLVLNFTWWVNRKDVEGNNLFGGGFLGLDNIGVFDRSRPLPDGGYLQQADGTAWMAFTCMMLLSMALELADGDPAYEDMASKFFEHFIAISDAINNVGGTGLWDEEDGFYYDQLHCNGRAIPLRVRSLVGFVPLIAVSSLKTSTIEKLPGFRKRMHWFLENRPELASQITCLDVCATTGDRLLAIPSRARLERILRYLLDETEFLSPYGVRSLSRHHREHPFTFGTDGSTQSVRYVSGESDTWMFGGNSNWRGPVWFPLNFLIIEALERYHHFYGSGFTVELPARSGRYVGLDVVARELQRRLAALFLPDASGRRPCHGNDRRWADDPNWRDLVLFYEYFDGDDGRGCGANHQTGWTSLVAPCLEDLAREREAQR
ncbi:MAG: glucosidase [bacterium]|nr:glucosidase [bacterium]